MHLVSFEIKKREKPYLVEHVLLCEILVVGELVQLDREVLLIDLPFREVVCLPKLLLLLLELDFLLLVLLGEAIPDFHELDELDTLTYVLHALDFLAAEGEDHADVLEPVVCGAFLHAAPVYEGVVELLIQLRNLVQVFHVKSFRDL